MKQFLLRLSVGALCAWSGVAGAEDWFRWRGPDLNGISRETNWTTAWPKEGPKVLWKAEVGTGFSSFAVSQGRAYTMGNAANQDTVFCFDAATGKSLWKHSYPCPLMNKYYDGGPHATPTVDADRVYTLGKRGQVFCLEAATGKMLWGKDCQAELGMAIPEWGFAGSPLVEGELLVLNMGDAGLALDKTTGKVRWQTGKSPSAYASPVPFLDGPQQAIALFGAKAVVAVDPASGRELWRYPWKTSYDVNAADPIVVGNQMFLSSGYGKGGGVIQFAGGKVTPLWHNKHMRNQINSCVLVNGFLYGLSGNDDAFSNLVCVEWKTGELKWHERSGGFGSLIAANGKLIVLNHKGELIIAEANPLAFKALARAQVLTGKCWTTPVLANGRIYCRNAKGSVVCVDVQAR